MLSFSSHSLAKKTLGRAAESKSAASDERRSLMATIASARALSFRKDNMHRRTTTNLRKMKSDHAPENSAIKTSSQPVVRIWTAAFITKAARFLSNGPGSCGISALGA